MQLPSSQRNLISNFVTDQVDAGSSPGEIRLYDDENKGTLGVILVLNDPAYTNSNAEGLAGVVLQPQIMGRCWLDITTNPVAGTPLVNTAVTYGEIVDSSGGIKQTGYVSVSAGAFIQLSGLNLLTSVQVQCINGYFETFAGNK